MVALLFLFVVFILIAWCPMPLPKPTPTPKRIVFAIILGAIGGGLVFYGLDLEIPLSNIDFLTVAVGVFAGGRVGQQLELWLFPSPDIA